MDDGGIGVDQPGSRRRRRPDVRDRLAAGPVLLLFGLVMLARLIGDWAGVFGDPRAGWLSGVRRVTHGLTEPVIAPVRWVLRPVRVGSVSIDLAFTVVFVAVWILRSVALSL
ncbi:YggT family protein [Pseudonocardia bannensis]|uniref:YggT family protein n=1 Tax=Pseudonocardia bannensis TaxID=630973 RepID=UPI0028A79322|nr:YggT family protein [Pseudonocardia bannensis]